MRGIVCAFSVKGKSVLLPYTAADEAKTIGTDSSAVFLRAALKILNIQTASELAEIIVSVGLAQNLAALRALATEGIQRGHMGLHSRQVAIAAGAEAEMIEKLAKQLVKDKKVRIDHAEEILAKWSENDRK